MKPDNIILLNKKIKLTDFGGSLWIPNFINTNDFLGTYPFFSTEKIFGIVTYNSDIYSIGVILLDVFS